jgi:hypothetical protein
MSTIRGRYIGGKVILDAPADWPEGAEVNVELTSPGELPDERPDDEDTSPEAIARRLALMDRVEPWMTPEEEAAWKKQREEDKAVQLAFWDKWTEEVGKLFQ